MDGKKEPGRFSVKFNISDPAHRMVIELLNQQSPRGKAQFIANAILHYAHCPETPDFMPPMSADNSALERMVLDILERQNFATAGKSSDEPKPHDSAPTPVLIPPLSGLPDEPDAPETKPDAASLAAISGTLAAFRRQ